jgi:hypothetical protein
LLTTDKPLGQLWAWFNPVGGTNNTRFLRTVSISGISAVLPDQLVSPHRHRRAVLIFLPGAPKPRPRVEAFL